MTATVRELFDGALNTSLQGKTADIGSTWRVAASTGTLNTKLGGDGTAYNTDSLDRAVNNTATAANDRVKARLTFDSSLTGTRQVGLAVRIQAVNDTQGYYLVFSPTGYDFFKLGAGGAGYVSIASGSLTIALGTPFTCEVVPSGSTFTLKYNEGTLATPTDSTYTSGGFSGLHVRAAKLYWFEAGTAGDPDPEGGGGTTVVQSDLVASYTISSSLTTITSDLAGSYQLLAAVSSDLAASYTIASNGTLTVPVVNNTNSSIVSTTIPHVVVNRVSDRTQVSSLASQATNSSGNLILSGLVTGTLYAVSGWNADGSAMFIWSGTAT